MKAMNIKSLGLIVLIFILTGVYFLPIAATPKEVIKKTEVYGNENIEVIYRKSLPIKDSEGLFPGLAPGTTVEDGIVIERDVAVRMRDGISIYADIYRPEGAVNIPALPACSPYGKRQGYLGRLIPGVPKGTTSPMAKFEGPEPATNLKTRIV